MNPLLGLFSMIGQGVSAFFGFKGYQADTLQSAMRVLSDINSSEDSRAAAIATIISSESQSASWITRTWRPLTVTSFVVMLYMFFFGYTPENVTPEIIGRIFDIITFSIAGYIPARTVDKIIDKMALASILKTYVGKKLG